MDQNYDDFKFTDAQIQTLMRRLEQGVLGGITQQMIALTIEHGIRHWVHDRIGDCGVEFIMELTK